MFFCLGFGSVHCALIDGPFGRIDVFLNFLVGLSNLGKFHFLIFESRDGLFQRSQAEFELLDFEFEVFFDNSQLTIFGEDVVVGFGKLFPMNFDVRLNLSISGIFEFN